MKYRLLGACAAAMCCAAAPAFAQSLSRVEVLALQQQLRDDGCGVTHVTGRLDATTRAAVRKCESKYSGATTPASMLYAMHIGFEKDMPVPTLANARAGEGGSMSAGGSSGLNRSMNNRNMNNRNMNNRGRRGTAGEMKGTRSDSMASRDSSHMSGASHPSRMMDHHATPKSPRDTVMIPRDTSTMRHRMPKMAKHDTMSSKARHDTMPSVQKPGTTPINL